MYGMDFKEIYALRKNIKNISREELEKAYLAISDEWLHITDDICHLNGIIDGSWPDADECIKICREKANV